MAVAPNSDPLDSMLCVVVDNNPSKGNFFITPEEQTAAVFGSDALPASPDVVAFCVSAERTLEAFRQLPAVGARAAVIFGGGFGEAGAWGQAAQTEIVDIAREAGIALCGPNCMGNVSMREKRPPTGPTIV